MSVETRIKEDLPLISTGIVVGRYIVGVGDRDDLDDEPDLLPARGSIRFDPSVGYIPVPVGPLPFTMVGDSFTGVFDSEGYLCAADINGDPVKRGLKLFATDAPDSSVKDWTWKVTITFTDERGNPRRQIIAPFDISVPTGGVVDLAAVQPVPSSQGVGLAQAFALSATAKHAAEESATFAEIATIEASVARSIAVEAKDVALSVEARLNAGGGSGGGSVPTEDPENRGLYFFREIPPLTEDPEHKGLYFM